MSLYKQLWLAVILLLILIFTGIFVVSSLSARAYLEQQLYMKNVDNVNALALSMTQQDADPVLMELVLSAQFDTGHYELIEFKDQDGNVTIERRDQQPVEGAPRWFTRLFHIEVQPGTAEVQKGWQQLGTLTLSSHRRFAYKELWQTTQKQAGIFLVAMIVAGLVGSYVLKLILHPLKDVVDQAEAIGERRFITTAEPFTLEFKAVVSSMNKLSQRVKTMLEQEAKRLEKRRQETQLDKITGQQLRDPFLDLVASTLRRGHAGNAGVLAIIRISDLSGLNERQGRKVMDTMLAVIGKALDALIQQHDEWAVGRLNGSEFAVLAPHALEPQQVGWDIQEAVLEVVKSDGLENEVRLPVASIHYEHGDTVSKLLTSLDATLLAADKAGESDVDVAHRGEAKIVPAKRKLKNWEQTIERGFGDNAFFLATYPVTDLDGQLIHLESPVHLMSEGREMEAGQFLPWINRLELARELDRHVVELALQKIEDEGQPIGINLSSAVITDPAFLPWLGGKLVAHAEAASQLWLEVQESTAYRHLDDFRQISIHAKTFGCRTGIEHMGHQASEIGQLHDVGVDYLKVDAAFIRNVDSNAVNQTLLRTLCNLGHTLGATVIAEGVQTGGEWSVLEDLGFDAATGPEITRRHGNS